MSGSHSYSPALRFPEFREPWTRQPLSTVLQPKRKRNLSGRYGRQHVLSVAAEAGVRNQIEYMGRSYAGVDLAQYHVVDRHDVVYTKSPLKAAPYGIIKANFGPSGVVSTLYAVYTIVGDNDPRFLDYYFALPDRLNAYLRPLVHIGAKNDMKISADRVLIDPVTFPGAEEQKKISDFLDAIDNKIALMMRKADALRHYTQGISDQIFERKIRFKRPDGSDFPEWRRLKIAELGTTAGGLTGKSAEDFGSGAPYVTYKQVFASGVIQLGACDLVRIRHNERQNRLRKGDIVFTLSSETPADIAVASVLVDEVPELYLNSFCFFLRPSGDHITTDFARHLFRSSVYRRMVRPLAQGSTRYNLSRASFNKLKLPIPELDEQQDIANLLSSLEKKIGGLKSKIAAMQTLKKGLLQQMFT